MLSLDNRHKRQRDNGGNQCYVELTFKSTRHCCRFFFLPAFSKVHFIMLMIHKISELPRRLPKTPPLSLVFCQIFFFTARPPSSKKRGFACAGVRMGHKREEGKIARKTFTRASRRSRCRRRENDGEERNDNFSALLLESAPRRWSSQATFLASFSPRFIRQANCSVGNTRAF